MENYTKKMNINGVEEEVVVNCSGRGGHGECFLVRADLMGIDELPENAQPMKADDKGRLVVAHSESGHDHYVDAAVAEVYTLPDNPLIKFLKTASAEEFSKRALLRHAKPASASDRHKTQVLEPNTLYRISIQRESTPEGWRRVQD